MRKKIFNICMKIIIIITLFLFSIIIFEAFVNNQYITGIDSKLLYFGYLFMSFIMIFLVLMLFKKINNISDRKVKVLKYLIWGLIICIEVILILNIDVMQISDTFFVQNEAVAIGVGEQDIVDYAYSANYFTKVGNNNLLLFILICVIKIFGSINKNIIIINAICINVSILLTCSIAKKVKDEKFALKVLILSALNPLNYLFIFFVYSTTLSLPFILGIVYLALIIKDRELDLKNIILCLLFGVIFALGFLLRPTEAIPLIALILAYIYGSQNKKKKHLLIIPIIIVSIFISYMLINKGLKRFSPDNTQNLPVTHFIMMGLHDSGTWNEKDIDYTMSYPTKQEKVKANIKEIENTLEEYKLNGVIKHLIYKCMLTWGDGTANYVYRLSYVNDGSVFYNKMIGQKNHLMKIYCQSFRIVTCLFIIISLMSQFRKKELDWRSVFSLTLFGAILFYLIWEGKSIYCIPFIPFMLILMADGVNIFVKKFDDILVEERKTIFYFGIGIIIFSLFLLISLKEGFTETENIYQSYNLVVTYPYNGVYIQDELSYSFYQSRKFNKIDLFIKGVTKNSTGQYIFELYKGDEIIHSVEFNAKDITDNKITIQLDEENPTGKEKYCIKVHNKNKRQNNFWFVCNTQKSRNLYNRLLVVDGKEYSYDLGVGIYYEELNTYMSERKFSILVSGTILLEMWILFNLTRKKDLKKTEIEEK